MELVNIELPKSNLFCFGDSEKLYLKNLSIMPDTWEWRTRKVHYSINSQGYRSPEWNTIKWEDSVLLFGCSFVFGVGISDEDTCAYHLSSMINKPVINLGVCGGSPMLQWVNTSIIRHNNISPKAVIYVWPWANRLVELLGSQQANHYGPWSKEPWCSQWILHDNHSIEYLRYAIWSVNAMWQCPVLHYHIDRNACDNIPELKKLDLGPKDYARDWTGKTAHPGPLTNRHWAKIIHGDSIGLW